jgi:carnitine 3-dehydrogenase
VSPAWIDYNGHMTEHRCLQVFGDTTDALLRFIGVDLAYVEAGHSYYTVETHLRHLDEARLGEALASTCQILSADEKRIHLFHRLLAGTPEREIATAEQMLLHVDSQAGRAVRAPSAILERVQAIVSAHARLEPPPGAGRAVGQKLSGPVARPTHGVPGPGA